MNEIKKIPISYFLFLFLIILHHTHDVVSRSSHFKINLDLEVKTHQEALQWSPTSTFNSAVLPCISV